MLILKKLRCIAFDLFILSVVIFQSNLGRKWMKAFVANLNLVSCFVSHAQEMSVRQRRKALQYFCASAPRFRQTQSRAQ